MFRKYFKWKHDHICINQGIKEKCYNREKHSFTTQFGWQTTYHSRRNNQYALTYSETAENKPNKHILSAVWIWKSKWQCKTLENKLFWKFSQYKYDLANLVIRKKKTNHKKEWSEFMRKYTSIILLQCHIYKVPSYFIQN